MALRSNTTIQTRAGVERLENRAQLQSKRTTFTADTVKDGVVLSQQLNAQQGQIQEAVRALNTLPILPGVLLQDVSFESGVAKTLQHRLGRPYRGFLLFNQRTAAGQAFRSDLSPTSRHANEIQLTPSATMTADVWVY